MKKYIKIFITFFLISTLIFIYEKEIYADTMDAYFMSESNFNIWGEGVQTTYNDHGYDTVLNVNGSETNIKNGTGSLNGVNLITNLTNISDGNYVKVEYIVTNNNNSSATIGIATHADIQIASNDRAPIDNISGNRGFTMSDGSHIFRFIGRDSYGVTNVDTYWFGTYNDRQANMWNTSYTYDGSNTDSGMAYSWKNRSIGPGETQKYSVIIGVGELNTPPTINVTSSFDKAYYPTQTVKVTGTVNDIDVGDVLTVKYAIDSGAEITIGNNYRPNGNAVPFNTSFVIPTSISTGQHMIQLWAADDKGNMSVPVTVYFNVGSDTTPPDATHQITPSSWTKGNVDIALKVTDSQSGVKNVTLPNGQVVTTTNINFTATNNGNYKFILVDNVGNSRDYIVTINNIDRTAPTITVNPKNSNWVQEIEVKIDILDNQSGVKYYKYAVTDSKDTPTTWSENIASVNGKVTIDTETEKYLHIIAEDNVGNITSDNVTGPYHIDKTAPSISVNPKTSDWARETQVQVSITDGGAGFKYYKYAITDNKNLPTTWSENIAKANDTITINTETEKYLHIIAEDNVGNITSDNVTGPYLIDRTNPTIQVIGDLQTIVVDELTLDLEANDVPSGVATFKMDGEVIFNGNHTFNKNGKHTLEAVDKAGNTYSTEFEITNIYYECDAGLEHPIYSSTYDSCPICEAYKGLKVTDAADIYNSERQGVRYENPRNAEIVEYYDGIKENPENVKEYEYELKVVYEGNEYKTGVWGKYTITPKIITIEDIIATNKVYNGNTTVVISGGRLIGVCEGDNLYFELPLTGEAESKNVGQWKVSIAEIKLIGEDAPNYILKHPEYGEIMVEITSRPLRIINLSGKNRIYNKETTVEIIGGEFDNLVEGDDVVATIPKTGEAESKNVGQWKVSIAEIKLIGEDAPNYILKHPEYGEIMVEITSRPLRIINLSGKNRIYNKETTVEIIGGEFDNLVEGDDVVATIPKTGEAESPDTGTWRVAIEEIILSGKDVGNYTFTQPEYGEIMVTISKETGILVIGCESKKYDRELIEPYVVEKNTTSEVTYKYYKAGTDEEIERPYDIGKYDVVGYAETDGNYTEVESNKVTFEIKKPDPPSIGIESRVVKVNEKTVTIEEQPAPIQYGDIVTIQIRIKNNGLGSGYAKKVTSTIADGMEYIEDNEINKANGWKLDGKKVTTSKYSYETDINNELYPKRYEYEENEDYSDIKNTITNEDKKEKSNDEILLEKEISNNKGKRKVEEGGEAETGKTEDTEEKEEKEEKEEEKPELNTGVQKLQLVLKVAKNDKTHDKLLSQIVVEQQDKRGDTVEYTKEDEETSKNRVEMQYTYTDLQIEKRITQIITTDKTSNTIKKYDLYQEPGNIVKLDLPSKNIGNTKLDIIYEIKVTNIGDYNAEIDQIIDLLPNGANFSKEGNEGWYVGENGHIIYDNFQEYLRPNEEKVVKLKLIYDLDEGGMAQIENDAYVLATKDIDEKIITDEGNIKIEETNNYARSELIVSIITGETILIYVTVILGGMLIIVVGISLIKKYIL